MRQDELQDIEANDFEKIGPTAYMIAYRRTFTDISYSQEIFDQLEKMRKKHGIPEIPVELRKIERTPLFEARYKLVDALISKFDSHQVFEIASGLSPRGFIAAENQEIRYVELDMSGIMKVKKRIIDFLKRDSLTDCQNLFLEEGSALDMNALTKAAAHFEEDKPITIINEGLLAYLSFNEKTILAKNIYSLLKRFGGVWITPDIVWPSDTSHNGHDSYVKSVQELTGSNIEKNRFHDENDARIFFEKLGFSVERYPFSDVYDQLVSVKKLGQTREEMKRALDSSVAFVLNAN